MTLFDELLSIQQELYPDRTVVGGFAHPTDANEVLAALVRDFGRMNISILYGEAGLRALDSEGVNHGLLGRAYRLLERAIGDAGEELERAARTLRDGGYLVYVNVHGADQKVAAVEVMKRHGSSYVVFMGRAVIERH
jgi:hypothetical protein